jgi:gentisate 1,2-dioxygenase
MMKHFRELTNEELHNNNGGSIAGAIVWGAATGVSGTTTLLCGMATLAYGVSLKSNKKTTLLLTTVTAGSAQIFLNSSDRFRQELIECF